MTVNAVNLDSIARFAVKFAVAVAVLFEVAVHAMHTFFKVDIFQMNSLLQFLGIVEGNNLVISVLQIAFAVVLEDGAEDPAVTMEIGKLRVLKVLVEFGCAGLFQKASIGPQTANC